MRKTILYEISSLYRQHFKVQGYLFGEGEKALCVVGSVRGNEYQQIYMCSQLVAKLKKLEEEGLLKKDQEILVIPTLNPYSMNIGKRFWPTDNTDINRMFPGYAEGETTQRIAAGVFEKIFPYKNGVQFASFYMPGNFLPHVRMMKTGYENVEKAKKFGLPYVILRDPKPYDTTTLNYNWQIWETDAFSVYSTTTSSIDEKSAEQTVESVLRFLAAEGILYYPDRGGYRSEVFRDAELLTVRPKKAGIFRSKIEVGDNVEKGEVMAEILDPGEGCVIEKLEAPQDGTVFFRHTDPLTYASTAVFKLLPI